VNVLKIKKIVSVLVAYVLLLTVVPVNFLVSSVKAAQVSAQTNVEEIKNYDIMDGWCNKLGMYGNYGLIETGDKLYMVKENYSRIAYQSNYFIEGFSGVKDDNAYLYSTSDTTGKNVIVVNLKTFSNKIINMPSIAKNAWLDSSVMDKGGALWFSITNSDGKGSNAYSILRLDPSTSQTSEIKLDASKISNFGQLVYDNAGSVWYKTENNLDNTQKMVKLIYNNGIVSQEFNTNVKINRYNYMVNNGDVWFRKDHDSNYYFLQLSLKNGIFDTNKSIKTSVLASMTSDNNGNLWMNEYTFNKNDVHTLSKLENGQFVPKYTTRFGNYSDVNIADDNHIVIANSIFSSKKSRLGYEIINEKNKPSAPKVSADDTKNIIVGIDNTMEYKINDGTWTTYTAAPDLSGDKTVQVRVKAVNGSFPGLAATIKFTTNK
jgi:hypothetical protein